MPSTSSSSGSCCCCCCCCCCDLSSFPVPLAFLKKGHFFLPSFGFEDPDDFRWASCCSTTLLFIRSMTFFMTLACLQGWTDAACKEVEWMKGSIVTVLKAWSAEMSWNICCGVRGVPFLLANEVHFRKKKWTENTQNTPRHSQLTTH